VSPPPPVQLNLLIQNSNRGTQCRQGNCLSCICVFCRSQEDSVSPPPVRLSLLVQNSSQGTQCRQGECLGSIFCFSQVPGRQCVAAANPITSARATHTAAPTQHVVPAILQGDTNIPVRSLAACCRRSRHIQACKPVPLRQLLPLHRAVMLLARCCCAAAAARGCCTLAVAEGAPSQVILNGEVGLGCGVMQRKRATTSNDE
jgi:hypothetical protein